MANPFFHVLVYPPWWAGWILPVLLGPVMLVTLIYRGYRP